MRSQRTDRMCHSCRPVQLRPLAPSSLSRRRGPARREGRRTRAEAHHFSRQQLIMLQWICQHKAKRVPAEGQPPERRDGFRIIGLVMSIILLHIFLL